MESEIFYILSIYLSYGKANIAIVVTYLKVKGTSLALQVLLLALILAISTEIPSKSWEDMGSAVQVPSIFFSILDPYQIYHWISLNHWVLDRTQHLPSGL